MLYSILLVFEVLLSIGLIVLILLQHGKGADVGAAFGSGASGTVFGSRGSGNFLSHSTAVLAGLFFINSLLLAYLISHQPKSGSVIDTVVEQPVAPSVSDLPTGGDAKVSQPATDVPAVNGRGAASGAADGVAATGTAAGDTKTDGVVVKAAPSRENKQEEPGVGTSSQPKRPVEDDVPK